ncbi:MAG: aspartate aminotransferase family protein [Deltaproteobacteria bacterium]|nr:MAG: aspartate aminotransferase family protein [Deltaproteobacteria bacterium]
MQLPEHGIPDGELFAEMRARKKQDADWEGGRTFSLIYPAGKEVDAVLRRANEIYVFENALNPFRFPSLRQMEDDVISMTLGLLNGGEGSGGAMTSGGTESILMAVKTARDRARAERGVSAPRLVAPVSAHPAFAKAASYLGLELVQIPLGPDLRADVDAARRLIDDDTALVVGSAPNYPFGTVDPIPELAALAAERGISFHTDGCLGGFLLPFLERLGVPVPPWDFRVPGVTTISADVHKYGYATKGASVIAHRDRDPLKKYQLFVYDRWPGGLYGSFAMAGARPGAPIAAAWAVMRYLGRDGYERLARQILDTVDKIRGGIEAIPGLSVLGDPIMSVFAFGSDVVDMMAVGDAMDDRGWCLDRQKGPDALHMMLSPAHASIADSFVSDLREAVSHHGPSRGVQARYS